MRLPQLQKFATHWNSLTTNLTGDGDAKFDGFDLDWVSQLEKVFNYKGV